MKNENKKLDLGHKPDLYEVKIFGKAIIDAGEEKMKRDVKKYWNADSKEEKDRCLVSIGMSYTLTKVGEMLNKFVDEGILEDPNLEDSLDKVMNKSKEEFMKEHWEEDEEWKKKAKSYKIFNMNDEDIDNSFVVINDAVKKVSNELEKKYGGRNALTLVAGYCETFLHDYKIKVKAMETIDNMDSDDDEHEGMEKVDINDAIKEMKREGLDDVAEALEKIAKKDGTTEVNVFKIKHKE